MDFQFTLLTHSPERLNVVSAKLGVSAAAKFVMADIGKIVKLGPVSNYVPVAEGDDIDGFVDSIEDATSGGFSFGGVAHPDPACRFEAKVGGATALTVGAQVVAGVQAALGTKSLPVVKAGTGAVYKYRVINLFSGAGAVGTTVLIERC